MNNMDLIITPHIINNILSASHQLAPDIGIFLSSRLDTSECNNDNRITTFTDNLITYIKESDLSDILNELSRNLHESNLPIKINCESFNSNDSFFAFVFLKTFETLEFKQKIQAIARHFTPEQLNDFAKFTNSVLQKLDEYADKEDDPIHIYKAKDFIYVIRGYIWRAQHPYLAHITLLSKTQKFGLAIMSALAAYCGYQWFSSSKAIEENHKKSVYETR